MSQSTSKKASSSAPAGPSAPRGPGPKSTTAEVISPGMRILCRDEEWLVRTASPYSFDGKRPLYSVRCVGMSDLVRGQERIFLQPLDVMEVVDPRDIQPQQDTSGAYERSLLYLESRLRGMPVSGPPDVSRIPGVFHPYPFQQQTLSLTMDKLYPRILIADGVGLGKTIQAGMILSELIRRGQGHRILVLTKKSMLTQFQSELWNRFNVPLIRLDSEGISRMRLKVPSNKNPFEVYHRIIISMDTLKQHARYEHHLEKTHWDVVIIDEAHKVAGATSPEKNLSNRLARKLAAHTEALILTTATPHNGKPETFGRLISLVAPNAISDPDLKDYSGEDVQNHFVMRFKEDVREEIGEQMKSREIVPRAHTTKPATDAEEKVFEALGELRNQARQAKESKSAKTARAEKSEDDAAVSSQTEPANAKSASKGNALRSRLIEYGLYKLFLSSPEALQKTVEARLKKKDLDSTEKSLLEDLQSRIQGLTIEKSSRFNLLLDQLKELNWDGGSDSPRIILFTESRATQSALARALAKKFKLEFSEDSGDQPDQVLSIIHGSTPDIHLNDTVEAFGTGQKPMRMLIATDVASEGINLHHECHNLIHYDLPWSIITLVQRNGRIDRIGQTKTPVMRYLMIATENGVLQGDSSIFERLIEKAEEVNRLRQPEESVLQLYDADKEAQYIAEAGIVPGNADVLEKPAEWARNGDADGIGALLKKLNDFRLGETNEQKADEQDLRNDSSFRTMNDLEFFEQGYSYLKGQAEKTRPGKDGKFGSLKKHGDLIVFHPPEELARRLGARSAESDIIYGSTAIPVESWRDDGAFRLREEKDRVDESIAAARRMSGHWAEELLLSELHPVQIWLQEQLMLEFPRGEVPMIQSPALPAGDLAFLFIGIIYSKGGHPLFSLPHAIVVRKGGQVEKPSPLRQFLQDESLKNMANTGAPPNMKAAGILVTSAVGESIKYLKEEATTRHEALLRRLRSEERHLKKWADERTEYLNKKLASTRKQKDKEHLQRQLKEIEEQRDVRRKQQESRFSLASDPFTEVILIMEGAS